MSAPKAKRRRIAAEHLSKEEEQKLNSTLGEEKPEKSSNNTNAVAENNDDGKMSKQQRKRLKKRKTHKHALLEKLSENNETNGAETIEAPPEPPKHVNPLITFDDFLPEVGKISQRAQRDLKTNYKLQRDDVRKKTQLKEIEQLKNIFAMPVFQQNPAQAIQQHLSNKVKQEHSKEQQKARLQAITDSTLPSDAPKQAAAPPKRKAKKFVKPATTATTAAKKVKAKRKREDNDDDDASNDDNETMKMTINDDVMDDE